MNTTTSSRSTIKNDKINKNNKNTVATAGVVTPQRKKPRQQIHYVTASLQRQIGDQVIKYYVIRSWEMTANFVRITDRNFCKI